jgi:hypothetical protein
LNPPLRQQKLYIQNQEPVTILQFPSYFFPPVNICRNCTGLSHKMLDFTPILLICKELMLLIA